MQHEPDEISLVPKDHVHLVLEEIRPILARLKRRLLGRYGPEDIARMFLDGTLDLWVVIRADRIIGFFGASIVVYPHARHLSVQFGAGEDMENVSGLVFRTLSSFARDTGCSHIEVLGRQGWARYLKRYGFQTAYVAVRREV